MSAALGHLFLVGTPRTNQTKLFSFFHRIYVKEVDDGHGSFLTRVVKVTDAYSVREIIASMDERRPTKQYMQVAAVLLASVNNTARHNKTLPPVLT